MNYVKKMLKFNQVKTMTEKGEYNYIKISKVKEQDYVVRASIDIKENTLICEYTGNVLTYKKFCNLDEEDPIKKNNSIIDLTVTPNSETSLIICPYKYSNIARFLSGVNNTTDFEDQVNFFSTKISINGVVRILLVAKKDIKKNDILYYNYNGDTNNFPTEDFTYQQK